MISFSRTMTPLGEVVLGFGDRGLAVLEFADCFGGDVASFGDAAEDARARDVARQLQEYFAGSRRVFEVALDLQGTVFQRRVWQSLLAIPFGRTWSYAEQAAFLGHGRAVRAVAAANGRNPVSVIVPCHRVIGSNGSLTGYGGGLERKAFLLRHEGAVFV